MFPRAVEAGRRPLLSLPHPAFRERFPILEAPINRAPLYHSLQCQGVYST